jgi:hypothetical protein
VRVNPRHRSLELIGPFDYPLILERHHHAESVGRRPRNLQGENSVQPSTSSRLVYYCAMTDLNVLNRQTPPRED